MNAAVHRLEQLHRQTDDVRLASFEDVDPIIAVLVAERTGFALPLLRIEIRFKIIVRNRLHDQSGCFRCLMNRRLTADFFDETESAQNLVYLTAQMLEHFSCIVFVRRFFENFFAAYHNRVATEDDSSADLSRCIACFLKGKPPDVFCRRFVGAAFIFGACVRRQGLENKAGFCQKLLSSWRRTGKDDRQFGMHGGETIINGEKWVGSRCKAHSSFAGIYFFLRPLRTFFVSSSGIIVGGAVNF